MARQSAVVLLAITCALVGCASPQTTPLPPSVTVDRVTFMGWPDAVRVRNGACEMVVVPQISRVMYFGRRGRGNVLFVNPELEGRVLGEDAKEWHNYGGDKVWPTQQSLFPKYAGRAWPPPWPWDGGASSVEIIQNGVRLTLPYDPKFGARLVREFEMDAWAPLVHVRQRVEKVDGPPVPMTIWSVCQVEDPEDAAFMPAGRVGNDGARFVAMGDWSPLMKEDRSAVALGRDATRGLKIGVRGEEAVAWAAVVTPGALFVVAHENRAGAEYPDEGCSAEIYTSPKSGLHYTELELLSPLVTLKAGEVLRDDQTWRLVELPGDGGSRSFDALAEVVRGAVKGEGRPMLRPATRRVLGPGETTPSP